MMSGTNLSLYKELSQKFIVDIVASGGVSSIDDVKALKEMKKDSHYSWKYETEVAECTASKG